MTATRKNIHQWISTGAATATIAIAGLTFQASSIAAPDAEALSAEARASLERQLAIAREERDALVLKTEGQVTDLTEALEAERAKTAKVQDQLATAESAQTDAKAEIAELSETLDAERAEMAKVQDQLATAESAQADAKAEIAELSETLDAERAEQAQLRDALEAAETARSQARAVAEQPVSGLGVSQADATDLGGELTGNGILIELAPDELRFDSASAVLPTTQLPTLDRVAEQLEDRPELSVIVQGHTDSLGSAQINQRLSQQRAEAIRRALIERGLDAERVAAKGAGSTQPIADNETPEGQRRNRRVEIYLLSAQERGSGAATDAEQ